MARVALGQCKDAYVSCELRPGQLVKSPQAQLAESRNEASLSLKLQQLELDIEHMEAQSPLVTLSTATSLDNSATV